MLFKGNNESSDAIKELEKRLSIKFRNIKLLINALTHRSALNENKTDHVSHNERLEFLGDAVLELIVTEYLFRQYPERPEGELTSFRAAIVKTESLAETAEKLKMGEALIISKGEDLTGGRNKPYILANSYEAVLGAIYMDMGYKKAQEFVERTLLPKINNIIENRLDIDSKSKLQELAQEELGFTPTYELVKAEGPDHDKTFTMQIVINGKSFGQGTGRNKQAAEQEAAANALKTWRKLTKTKA